MTAAREAPGVCRVCPGPSRGKSSFFESFEGFLGVLERSLWFYSYANAGIGVFALRVRAER
ncbi:Uncharacterised protein [Mycobacterium tuberculosis]|nr:Uncharacterised protein [Mycobacterium tuberculosis]